MGTLDYWQLIGRLACAFIAGLALGFERESHGRPAGLKTTVLVCMAAAIAMILSEHFYARSIVASAGANWRPDPSRLAAGILAGMGFIGGGVIIQHGNMVRGVTTASVLWFVTVIGFCFGGGMFALGVISTCIGLLILFLLPLVEKRMSTEWYATLTMTVHSTGPALLKIHEILKNMQIVPKSADLEMDLANQTKTYWISLKFRKDKLPALEDRVITELCKLPGVLKVCWKN